MVVFKYVAALLCLTMLFLPACSRQEAAKPSNKAHNRADSPYQARRNAYKADSIAQVNSFSRLLGFYNSLIEQQRVVIDTSWYQNLANDAGTFEEQEIMLPRGGDDPADYVSFPFTDISMTYHDGGRRDYFQVNGSEIPETVYSSDNRFFVSNIYRFSYRSKNYLVFTGGPRDYNGFGDRINFNYFFDLSGSRIAADMYENSWGYVRSPLLYGDLNNDGRLDRVRFDGIARPSERPFDTVHITAETYQRPRWKSLVDARGKPYFIELLVEEGGYDLKIGNSNWVKPVLMK
jgi:hypothetical protein